MHHQISLLVACCISSLLASPASARETQSGSPTWRPPEVGWGLDLRPQPFIRGAHSHLCCCPERTSSLRGPCTQTHLRIFQGGVKMVGIGGSGGSLFLETFPKNEKLGPRGWMNSCKALPLRSRCFWRDWKKPRPGRDLER